MKLKNISSLTINLLTFFLISSANAQEGAYYSNDVTLNDLYDILPNISRCGEGRITEAEKQKALTAINTIRKLHGLKDVSYDYAGDLYAAKSALIMSANGNLSHEPDSSWKCYSKEGFTGSQESNLFYTSSISFEGDMPLSSTLYAIDILFIDKGTVGVGHRRWFLDPFLKKISYARVDNASKVDIKTGVAVKVMNNESQDISDLNIDFIAYPQGNYPRRLHGEGVFSSFTALYNKKSTFANEKVDYSNTSIDIESETGEKIDVTNIYKDNYGFGIPNLIQWTPIGLKDNVRYNVSLKNVMVEGVAKNYNYWFQLD